MKFNQLLPTNLFYTIKPVSALNWASIFLIEESNGFDLKPK
jgi:hypothetical protein